MGSIVTDAELVADRLADAGVPATTDPRAANTNRPCALVLPPAMDYLQQLTTWRVALLSSHGAGSVEALAELDQLLVGTLAALPTVEAADPASYVLAGVDVPAYIVRFTTA